MNFISNLIDTYNKGLKYDKLEESFKALDYTIEVLQDTVNELDAENRELSEDYIKLKSDLDKLTASKNFNVNDHKDWYISRRLNKAWIYDGKRLGRKDVKNYLKVSKEGEEAIKKQCNLIINKFGLRPNSNAELIPKAVMRHFMGRGAWTYKYDKDKQGKPEFWQNAYTSLKDKSGDCEDLAILMYNLIYYIFEILDMEQHKWRITFTAATVIGEGGHAFNTFLADDGRYYVVESTFDLVNSYKKTWLKTPIDENNLYSNFWGFATKEKSWKVSNTSFYGFK